MVQLVASAAASAIVTSTVAAQTQDGRARQSGTAADAGGGWFADLLAELLQDAQPSQNASQIPTDPSQQTTADASTAAGAFPDVSKSISPAVKDPQSSANGQNGPQAAPGNQNNWLAAWLAAMAQTQAAGQASPQSTGTSPQAMLAALLQGKGGQDSSPPDAQKTDGTQDSGAGSQDAGLLAALQSLAAQFAQAQTGTATQPQSSQSTTDAVGSTSGTPSNAQLAALLQTLQTQAAAMTGASTQSDATTADAQQTTQATDTAATTAAPAAGQTNPAPQTPTQRTPFSQTSQQALHSFAAPATPVPPAHSGSGANAGSQGQSGQRGAAANAQSDAQTGTQTVPNASPSAASGITNQPTFLQVAHDQSIVQQNTGAAAAQDNAVNAVASATPGQAPTQAVAANLHVGPATQTANPAPDVQSLAVNIATQSQAGAKQFNIRLDPPELGRVDVRLTVDAAGKAQAHLAVDKPQTLELLQKDSGNLARALKDSGVQLSNNGLQFSLKGQGRNGDGSRGSQSRGRSLSVTAVASAAPAAAASSSNFSASASGVDIRV